MKKIVVIAVVLSLAGPVSAEWYGSKTIRAYESMHRSMGKVTQMYRELCQITREMAQGEPDLARLVNPTLWCGIVARSEADVNRVAAEIRRLRAMEAGAKR